MMIDFARDLNAEQLAAVTSRDGPLLVVAGAGSGKTRVLTYRLAWLVEQGVAPADILLMTFTNRAAREMLERVEFLLTAATEGLTGGTFHHVANRLLRRFADPAGCDPEYTIIDREDAKQLMRGCLPAGKSGRSARKSLPNQGVLVAMAGFMKNTLQSLPAVLSQYYPMFSAQEPEVERILISYERAKREMKVMDFDDLLRDFYRLLRDHEPVRDYLSNRFRYILVDEYQDTNRVQGEIVDLLAGRNRNLCVVGDDAQSIYSFRGASFANIIQFTERYPDAQVFRLQENYRSRPPILAVANASIAVNRHRFPKRLVAVRENGERPCLVCCHDGNHQARLVAGQVRELLSQGVAPAEIAVLYRSHYHCMEIQLQLQRQGIAFQVRGGLRFFEQAHVKDLIAFLRAAGNRRDQTAWQRLLPMLPGVGEMTAARIGRFLAASDQPLPKALGRAAAELVPGKAKEMFAIISGIIVDAAGNLSRPGFILEMVNSEFYDAYMLSAYSSPQRRREDLRAVVNFAGQYSKTSDFLTEIALAGEYSGLSGQPPARDRNGGGDDEFQVVLSTIHQAKGLEWSAVLIPWLVEGRFPASQSLASEEALEEERRVFHVASTRAENRLFMYAPRGQLTGNGYVQEMTISRFVTEIPGDLIRSVKAPRGGDWQPFGSPAEKVDNDGRADSGQGAERESACEWSDDGFPVIYQD